MNYELKEIYGFSAIDRSPITLGLCSDTNTIHTSSGKFFQKVYQDLTPPSIKRIIGVCDFLQKRGFPLAHPIKTLQGSYIAYRGDKPSVLFSYLPGRPKNKFSKEDLIEIGRTLARLHVALKEYPHLDEFVEEGKDYNSTEWYDSNLAKLESVNTLESKLIKEEYNWLNTKKPKMDLNELPFSLLHWDFIHENILFQEGKITGITDFEFMKYDNRIYDIIFSIIGFCMITGDLNKKATEALFKGYESISPLENSELGAFPHLLKLMTWDKWCSLYVALIFRPRKKENLKKSIVHHRGCYLKIKNDSIL